MTARAVPVGDCPGYRYSGQIGEKRWSAGGTLKTQCLFVRDFSFLLSYCCTTPNSDIIFNMAKEVTLWKEKKKKDSTVKMLLSPWRQWQCSLGVHQEWWFLQRCGSPGEESRSCERGHSFHSPQSTQFCQPRCHQLPPPLRTASAWSPQFWKRKSAYNTWHQANISDNDKSPYQGWLPKV